MKNIKGHSYANAAEDYEDREAWVEAAEAHSNAAEQFQKAIEFTQDAVTCKTLRLLHLDHLRKAKELERKITKIKQQQEEEQEKQRQLQQQQNQRPLRQSNHNTTTTFDMNGLRHALQTSRRLQHPNNYHNTISTTSGTTSPAIGGSYAVLPPDGRLDDEDNEDESDPFNKFWEVVETLVDKLSNPVAFASVPLNENDNPTPAWNLQKHEKQDEDEDGVAAKMVESYFFVPEPRQGNLRQHDYAAENEQLKKQIEQLVKRVQTLEKTAEESNMLKSSILQFRNDVQKQAKRIMQSHDYSHMRASSSAALMATSNTNTPSYNPITNISSSSSYIRPSSDLAARVKELEEENRQLRIQSEKQQALMNKYRERWEKLKESAKKRRSQQPNQQDISSPSSSSNMGGGNNNNNRMNYTKLASCSSEYVSGGNSGRQPTLLRTLAQQSSPVGGTPPFADPSPRQQASSRKGTSSSSSSS
ncbi:hypothetical protein INT45_010439 [Circinella minor]|uniref:Uncharacterized protein n=1 Tax=Circinella minor TaxID=1195481 RepID=A0A8H7RZS8_9FUNG|nr:hypothetical protein INT45_010439 [Circinella minor]